MAVTFGFYNSLNGDRPYNANHFSKIFNGIINDGVFMSIGDKFAVTESSGMKVAVGTGRAWFDGTWLLNDAPILLTVPQSELILNRIDTFVIETNYNTDIRANSIKLIKGIPSSNPVPPELIRTELVNQYAIANIAVNANIDTIDQSMIENRVGIEDTPFVTGILATMNIDMLISQWQSQWTNWMTETENTTNEWILQKQQAFDLWFDTIQDVLDENVAANLLSLINGLENNKLDKTDVIDSLLSSEGGKALSANQGKVLNEMKSNKAMLVTTSLLASAWTGSEAPFYITLTVAGVKPHPQRIEISLLNGISRTPEQKAAFDAAMISGYNQLTNTIVLMADGDKPEIDIPIEIEIGGDV